MLGILIFWWTDYQKKHSKRCKPHVDTFYSTFYSDSRYSIVQGLQSGAWLGVTITTATTPKRKDPN